MFNGEVFYSKQPNVKAVLDGLNEVIQKTYGALYRTTIHLDNYPMENFLGIMKQEIYYGVVYESFEALEHAVKEYIYYYNYKLKYPNFKGSIQFF